MNLLENQRAAETIDSIYMELEDRIILNIAKHLRDWKQPIDSDSWQLQKLAELGRLNQENIEIIAEMSGLSQTAVERMLSETAEKAIESMDLGIQELIKKGLIGENVKMGKSKNVDQSIKHLQEQAKDKMNLTNTTMLHKAQEAFKTLVNTTAGIAIHIMNHNAAAVLTGAESRQEALRKTIEQFAERGITGFVDKRGRNWSPEAYVNMTIRTTVRNVAEEVQNTRCKEIGVNLIEIDSHSGARPKCAKDQGKIFDLNNKSGHTEDLKGKRIEYYPWKSSSYGEPDGILGINCRHHKWPFIPKVNIRTYFPTEDMDANNKLYKQTQVQRALERDVRKQKRKCMLYDEIGDQDAFKAASTKLKVKEARLKEYVDAHKDLHRRKDREQVIGFDKRISPKAIATKKYVDKYSAVRYNKDGTVIVSDDWKNRKHASIPKEYKENAIIEVLEKKGVHTQVNRTFYDSSGKMYRQTHAGAHANMKQHPYGENGEHAHDYEWNNGKIVNRTTRELTDAERRESGDIL